MGKYSKQSVAKAVAGGDSVAIGRVQKLSLAGSKNAKRLLSASGITSKPVTKYEGKRKKSRKPELSNEESISARKSEFLAMKAEAAAEALAAKEAKKMARLNKKKAVEDAIATGVTSNSVDKVSDGTVRQHSRSTKGKGNTTVSRHKRAKKG